jgi:quercetin dioxygenase-like cupin family protein
MRMHLKQQEIPMRAISISILAAVATAGCLAVPVMQAQQSDVKRTDLQTHDLSIAGREVVQVRVDFAAGGSFPAHRHPGEEIIYIIEGTLEYHVEGRAPKTYRAGEVLIIPYGASHWVKNLGTDNGAELATYIVEKGKPLLELVK